MRILIAEDDPDSRWALSTLLTRLGHKCEVASNGQEALEKARSFAPGAIVMDLKMPVLGGLEATRRLKADARTRDIPVLAVSANVSAAGAREARIAGCEAYFTKPLAFPELLERLGRHAGR